MNQLQKNKTGFQLLVQMFVLYVHFVIFGVHGTQVTEDKIVLRMRCP